MEVESISPPLHRITAILLQGCLFSYPHHLWSTSRTRSEWQCPALITNRTESNGLDYLSQCSVESLSSQSSVSFFVVCPLLFSNSTNCNTNFTYLNDKKKYKSKNQLNHPTYSIFKKEFFFTLVITHKCHHDGPTGVLLRAQFQKAIMHQQEIQSSHVLAPSLLPLKATHMNHQSSHLQEETADAPISRQNHSKTATTTLIAHTFTARTRYLLAAARAAGLYTATMEEGEAPSSQMRCSTALFEI